MRRLTTAIALFLAAAAWLAGEAVLRGKITRQDRPGQAVADAQISAFGANSVSSTSAGLFELTFPDKKPGEVVTLTVQKRGYRMLNLSK